MADDQPDVRQLMQMMQQKIGNLELTVHALMQVLEEEDLLTQERINEQAQEIVKEMQQQDMNGEVPDPEKAVDEIETDDEEE